MTTAPELCPEARYVILDIETTGLDRQNDDMLQIAWMVLDEKFVPVLRQPAYGSLFLRSAKPVFTWGAKELHTRTGFAQRYEAALASGTAVSTAQADALLSAVVKKDTVLVGNQVEGFDLPFLRRLLPKTVEKFSYHVINVSSTRDIYATARGVSRYKIKESFGFNHDAWGDVCACHKEMLFYRNLFVDVTKG